MRPPVYGLKLFTAATGDPVTLAQVKDQVRVAQEITAHDEQLRRFIKQATRYIEEVSGRQVMSSTWDLYLDRFPCGTKPIELPRPPLTSVTSITYVDSAGASQTWSASEYIVSTSYEPARITPAWGYYYPTARCQADAVRVRYVAGYASADDVPDAIKSAILLQIELSFERPERPEYLMRARDDLVNSFRVGDEFTCYGQEPCATTST